MIPHLYWLASYPKSGNTWMRSFLANLLHEKDEPLEINHFNTGVIASGRSWMDDEFGFDTAELSHDEIDRLRPEFYRWINSEVNEDSYHKCHDAYTYLDNGDPLFPTDVTRGVIYIIRNPLDIVISNANHYSIGIDQSIDMMAKKDHVISGNIKGQSRQLRQKVLSWSRHVLSWVEAKGVDRLVVRYEDMNLYPESTFSKIAAFLNLDVSAEAIGQALNYCDFHYLQQKELEQGFRERPQRTNKFFRNGKVGEWESILTNAQIEKVLADHSDVMRQFGYVSNIGEPQVEPLAYEI